MCGICGAIGNGAETTVNRILEGLRHRGPDDHGVFLGPPACLGHTRLSILDLSSTGHQPMPNEDNTLWVTFNGEIYNFPELRTGLLKDGHVFRSGTDTEIILHLYEKYGEDCVRYLRGMFAFAVWDDRKKKLFAARDPFGIKPFYFYHHAGSFVFSSELRSFFACGFTDQGIDPEAVRGYFYYGSVPDGRTLLKGVRKLAPGHGLVLENGRLEIRPYYGPEPLSRPVILSEEEAVVETRRLLEESVRIAMMSDVPLGAFLSGGIDSSIIVAIMRKYAAQKVKTFSLVFDEARYDERQYSRRIAKMYDTDHHEVLLGPGEFIRELPRVFEFMDQPSFDFFNSYFISRAVKAAGLTVALSGMGGDELFAGYPLFRRLPAMHRGLALFGRLPRSWRKGIVSSAGLVNAPSKIIRSLEILLSADDLAARHACQRAVFLPYEIERLLPGETALFDYDDGRRAAAWMDEVNVLSVLERERFLLNTLLPDADIMSMGHSLELRVPLMDHVLWEHVLRIPGRFKTGGRFPKRLLVRACRDLLPSEICQRPKMGFVFPFEDWFRARGRDYLRDVLSPENVKRIPFLDSREVLGVRDRFLKGDRRYNYAKVLTLLSFVKWAVRSGK